MAGGHGKEPPTAAIFQKKCGRWYFENADGREKPAKPRPVEPQMLSTGRAFIFHVKLPDYTNSS